VNRVLPKRPRQRLDPELYDRLREQVLRRDGWRCRSCGARSNLEVHHMEFRGQGGDDAEENLISFALDVTPACISPEKSTPNFRLRFLREEPYDTN
jgi:hypothetical protein